MSKASESLGGRPFFLGDIMDGVMKGKEAYIYDKNTFSKNRDKKIDKSNSFVSRNITKGSTVADLCCGSGISISFLKKKAGKIYGIDASEEMIKICRERFSDEQNIEFILSDVKSTPLENESCDFVLVRFGLHHIKDKKSVIEEAYRILKSKGRMLILDRFCKYGRIITFIYDAFRNISRGYGIFGHHYISLEAFKEMAKERFKTVEIIEHPEGIYCRANIVLEKP